METAVSIKRGGGVPEVRIHIGKAQLGTFCFFLWKPKAEKVPNGLGTNEVVEDARFPAAGSVAELENRKLSWQVAIQTLDYDPNESYNLVVKIVQDGTEVFSKTYPEVAGEKLDGDTLIVRSVRFTLTP